MGFWSSIVAIAGVVAAPFTGGASLWLTAAAVIAPKVVDKVADFVMKPFMSVMGVPEVGSAQEAERQQGVLVQRTGSVSNIPVVYGYRKVGDIVTFAETGSTDNKYLWVAHVYSEGPIAGLAKLFCDDNELPANVITRLNSGQVVDVDSGKYSGRMRLQFFPGHYYRNPASSNHEVRQTCFFNTDSVRPPNWTPDMVYNGLAVLFARYEWKKVTTQAESDAQPYGGSIPSMTAEIFGVMTADVPATAPANEYDYDNVYYTVLTTGSGHKIGYVNPVEALLDYMRNPRYGKGLKNSDIDWASWHTAAQKCQTEVTYANGIKGPIMNFNFVLDTSQTLFSNTKTMLSNFRGYLPYSQGKYKLKIEDAGHPTDILSGEAEIVAEFNRDSIVGDVVFTGIDRSSKYNQVVVTWVDPDNKWSNQEVVFPETESERQYFIDQDGGRENKGTFTASAITNQIMAKDLARIIFFKSRLQNSISLTVNSQGIEIEPGDNIHIKANVINMNDTSPYRVISSTLNNDMSVTLGCVWNPEIIYPYTRWGEPDRLLPVYVPKGAERYYPAVTFLEEKNGLIPPWPGKALGYTSNSPLSDTIYVTKTDFVSLTTNTVSTSGNVYVDVTFTQPNTPLYASTKFYWKEDVASATTWAEFESLRSPGANQEITVRLGPVIYGKTYVINTRVVYQSGEVSSKMGTYTFTVGSTAIVPVPAPGTPVPPPTPPANPAADSFASIVATTVLTGGVPSSPRKVQFTVKQDMTAGNSSYLNALEVFWKPSGNTKWNYLKNPVTGTQGSPITLTLDCGIPVYPLVPGAGAPAAVDDFDFIFRWAYSDGKISNYQYRAMNCSTEWSVVTHNFNPLTTGTVTPKEASTAYTPIVATAADIVETRNISITTYAVKSDTGPSIRFFVSPPVATDFPNWVGVRVYRHKAGVAGVGDYVDVTPAHYSGVSKEHSVQVPGITLGDNWEYVVVPLVYYGTSVVEANKAQYIVGTLVSSTDNQFVKFRVDNPETLATALAKRGSASLSPPTRTTEMNSANITTVLTGGVPNSPRKVQFNLQQNIAGGVNGRISGIAVYYKQADATYWKKSKYSLSSYTEGTPFSFDSTQTTPVMDLGYPSYPSFPGREQVYNFKIRFTYDDNSEGVKQSSITGKIEDEGLSGAPDYAITLTGFPVDPDTTVLITEDQAPPGAVFDIRDIMSSTSMPPLQLSVFTDGATHNAKFYFGEPISTLKGYLAGFRILRRPVVSGANPDFVVNDDNFPYRDALNDDAYLNGIPYNAINCIDTGFDYQTVYEWAVIPVVWYQGIRVEANKCVYWKGKLTDYSSQSFSVPYTTNFYGVSTPKIVDTAGIRDTLHTTFPETDPVVKVQSIKRTDANTVNLGYHTITYQVPATFVSATIYRRCVYDYNNIMNGSVKGKYYDKGNFSGAGRWEKITINNTSNPLTTLDDGSKLQTVNLRSAIYDEFNSNSNPSKIKENNNYTNTMFKPYSNISPTETGSPYPLTQLLKSQYMATQVYIVINYMNGATEEISTKGIRCDLYDYRNINGVVTYNAPGVINVDCTEVSTASMEAAMDITALDLSVYATTANPTPTLHPTWTTMYRKMSEGRTAPVANNKIMSPTAMNWSLTYTPPTATPPVI